MRKVNWLIIGGAVVVAVITLILSLVDQSSVFHDLLKDINRALVVGVIVGGLTSLISNEILTVKKNNDKLRQLGIHSIGEGKLDKKQAELMFGSKKVGYPEELKFFLITGINFFRDFKLQMLEAMANGTVIKLLVADEKLSTDFFISNSSISKKESEQRCLSRPY